MKFLAQLKPLILVSIPKERTEKILFFSFAVFYLLLGYFIAAQSSIIYSDTVRVDTYFDFDASQLMNTLFLLKKHVYFEVPHPLINLILFPIVVLCEIAIQLFGKNASTFVVLFFTSFAVAASVFHVYKYLRLVVKLNNKRSLLLAVFFGFFANSLIISFTPESYPFTQFFLTLIILYYSLELNAKRSVPVQNILLLTIITGGITFTNAAKALIPTLFFKQHTEIKRIRNYVIYMFVFLSIIVVYFTFISLFVSETKGEFFYLHKIKHLFFEYRGNNRLTEMYRLPFVRAVIVYFFGAPLLFPSLSTVPLYADFKAAQINFIPYQENFLYFFVALVFVLFFLGFIRNYKNNLVKMLLLFYVVDIIIHVVLKWGLLNAYIFGGHWVFLVPLILGWLYASFPLEKNKKQLDIIIVGLFVVFLIKNSLGLFSFVTFALTNYGI